MSGGEEAASPSLEALRIEARRRYGLDPAGYDAGRPPYPGEVYDILADRCGLAPGSRVLEIGPGTGLVTRRLVTLGAKVVAVEPEPALAEHLAQSVDGSDLRVVVEMFEEAQLDDDQFDLAVAATSFHWVDPAIGAPKLSRVVRPGGWVAIWWTVLGDPRRPDPCGAAMVDLFGPDPEHPVGELAFQLDLMAGLRDLERLAGLVDMRVDVFRWSAPLEADQLRALYASLSHVQRQSPTDQQRLFAALDAIAGEASPAALDHPFATAMYTGRCPWARPR